MVVALEKGNSQMFVTKCVEPATQTKGFVLFPGSYAIEVQGRSQQPMVVQLLATSRLCPKHALL